MLQEGFNKLEAELKNLKSVERPAVVAAIEEARAHGDLSENAEYHAAKEQQGHIETRIMVLEGMIGRAQVINPAGAFRRQGGILARPWTLLDEDDKEVIYQIVGEEESDIPNGRISFKSPIARALIGREVEARG